jgi:hypothetical protein
LEAYTREDLYNAWTLYEYAFSRRGTWRREGVWRTGNPGVHRKLGASILRRFYRRKSLDQHAGLSKGLAATVGGEIVDARRIALHACQRAKSPRQRLVAHTPHTALPGSFTSLTNLPTSRHHRRRNSRSSTSWTRFRKTQVNPTRPTSSRRSSLTCTSERTLR